MAAVRLFAHGIVLFLWAVVSAVLRLNGTTLVIVLMCATIGVASVVAERERTRRRRDRSSA